jgi:trans-2,3-dihydro-3-hydroxyanthranilate isomerase
MKRAFVTVDVFTDRRFGGNPLAVFPEAGGLSDEQMQLIAAEFNYAETTFVLPPEDPAHTARVRIFTPKAELPFAGHPNVGTAFVLAASGRATGDRLVFEEKAGLVPMDIRREAGIVVSARLAAPQPLTVIDEVSPAIVAEAVGLAESAIVGRPVIASTGVPFLFAELKSREALRAAAGRRDTFEKHLPPGRAVGIHLFVPVTEDAVALQARMFAPLYSVPEDPATGGANVTLAGLLAQREPEPDLTFGTTVGQGFDMGRPSILELGANKEAGRVVATYIGGKCVPMLSGTIELD